MSKSFSNSQIAKLGDRLRDGVYDAEDLVVLSEYRSTFASALAQVVAGIRSIGGVEPTERAEKSTQSIVHKLQRMRTTQLGQMQDIAGCRLVVDNVREQDRYAELLKLQFPDSRLHDLRDKPHSGYRAVHLVARTQGRRVEVQVRTGLQDSWAQCSEHWAFSLDPAIKYGGGDQRIQSLLMNNSMLIARHENVAARLLAIAKHFPAQIEESGLKETLADLECELQLSLLKFKQLAELVQQERKN